MQKLFHKFSKITEVIKTAIGCRETNAVNRLIVVNYVNPDILR